MTVPRERLEASYQNLDRANEWIASADNKAVAVLAAVGVLLGISSTQLGNELSLLFHREGTLTIVRATCFGAYMVVLAFAFLRGVLVFFPRTAEKEESIFFFGSISKLSMGEFERRMLALQPSDIERNLIHQTHINARIVGQKFGHVRAAIIALTVSLGILLAFVLLKAFDP